MAFCGRCIALITRSSLPARPAIAAAVLAPPTNVAFTRSANPSAILPLVSLLADS
jgi:hypothetical protein